MVEIGNGLRFGYNSNKSNFNIWYNHSLDKGMMIISTKDSMDNYWGISF
ncbi:MAG: hypothetical protein WCR29_02620 [Bacteroidales bacterium]